jgi:hypothetical protein
LDIGVKASLLAIPYHNFHPQGTPHFQRLKPSTLQPQLADYSQANLLKATPPAQTHGFPEEMSICSSGGVLI